MRGAFSGHNKEIFINKYFFIVRFFAICFFLMTLLTHDTNDTYCRIENFLNTHHCNLLIISAKSKKMEKIGRFFTDFYPLEPLNIWRCREKVVPL